MATIRTNLITINNGIDTIVREQNVAFEIPEQVSLKPAETVTQQQLDRLLAYPTIDEFIAEQLRPQFNDGAIFIPQKFRALLEMTPGALRAAAEKQPSAARQLGKAARLLADGVGMHELLQMYRSALLQG